MFTKCFSFIAQFHSFDSREIDTQILCVLIVLNLSYLRKKDLWKMKVLQIFGLWNQEIHSWIMNHESLITILLFLNTVLFQPLILIFKTLFITYLNIMTWIMDNLIFTLLFHAPFKLSWWIQKSFNFWLRSS